MSNHADSPAFYEERLRLLEEQYQRLSKALAEILVEASAYHGGLNRKSNALASIVVKARTALTARNDA